MVKFYQNRELSGKLGVNLARWKRWSREFLPPDPLGGLQSGYARQYSLDDAFCVYLGGYLVSELKFSMPEAKRILSDLHAWMRAHRFYGHGDPVNAQDPAEKAPAENYRIHMAVDRNHGTGAARIAYRIRRAIAAGPAAVNAENAVVEQVVEEAVSGLPKAFENDATASGLLSACGSRVLQITDLYRHFSRQIQGDESAKR